MGTHFPNITAGDYGKTFSSPFGVQLSTFGKVGWIAIRVLFLSTGLGILGEGALFVACWKNRKGSVVPNKPVPDWINPACYIIPFSPQNLEPANFISDTHQMLKDVVIYEDNLENRMKKVIQEYSGQVSNKNLLLATACNKMGVRQEDLDVDLIQRLFSFAENSMSILDA